jgi:Flp pilus assembly protein TadG
MAHSLHSIKLLHSQRGGAALLFVMILPVLLGFAALSVDLANIHRVKAELQNAADAAALAGAGSLTTPGGDPYNWSAATATAQELAQKNFANGSKIQDAQNETGYWNLQSQSWNDTAPGTGDVPAVRATIAISGTENNGPLQLFFAPIFSFFDHADHSGHDLHASAVAVIAPPSSGTGLFPFVIGKKMLDHYWDLNTSTPVLQHGVAPTIKLGTVYQFGTCQNQTNVLSGQWTTFQSSEKNPNVTFMRNLIENGSPTELSIGDDTYIQPGAKATLYSEVPVGTDVAMFVVDNVLTNSFVPVVAIAGFHIDGYSQGGKYITGHFIDAAIIPGLKPGTGTPGTFYGAYTPPVMVH